MVEVKEECYGVGDESRCRVAKVAYRPRSDETMTGGAGLGKKVERQLKESPVAKLQAGKDA